MGMSTHVKGFRPKDAEWKKMKAVWDACGNAEIDLPKEVAAFFDNQDPEGPGFEVDLPEDCLTKYHDEDHQGYELNVRKIPDGVYIIRFYNSW